MVGLSRSKRLPATWRRAWRRRRHRRATRATGGSASSVASSSRRRSCLQCRSSRRLTSRLAGTRRSSRELQRLLHDYAGRPTPVYFAANLTPHAGGRTDLPEEGRPAPRRRAQDQQHHRAGPPGEEDGQRADHRRDRGRAARSRHGHGLRGPWPKGGGLHGPEDIERQKLNVFRMKLLGAEVHPRGERFENAQGRDKRGASGTGSRMSGRPTTFSAR